MSTANSLIVATSTFPFGGPTTNSLLQYYCEAASYQVSTGSPGYPFARGGGYPPPKSVSPHVIVDGDHDYAVAGFGPTADSIFAAIAYQGSIYDARCIGEFDKQTGIIKRIAVLPCSEEGHFIVDAEGGIIYTNTDLTTIARLPAHGPRQSPFIAPGETVSPLCLRLSAAGEIGMLILDYAFVPALQEIRRYDAAGNYLGLWITSAELTAVPAGTPFDYYTSVYFYGYFDFVFGPGDSIYVTDGHYNRILIFEDQTGRFSKVLIRNEDLDGWTIVAMALSPDNEFLYLSTVKFGPPFSCAIQVFPAAGGKRVSWIQLGAQRATGMTFITQDVASTQPIGSLYGQPEYPIWEILFLLRLVGDPARVRPLRALASFSPAAMDKTRRVWEALDEKGRQALTAAGIIALSRLLRDPALHTELRSLIERNFAPDQLDRLQVLLNRRRPSVG